MTRRLLLRLALAALACSPLAFSLDAAAGAGAANTTAAARADETVTQGSLRAVDSSDGVVRECPLKHTAVRAEVSGFISRVTVTQDFENPFPDKIEAVYVFPLPQGAAVDDMTMLVGGRTIRARIMRREEAQAAYRDARERGHVASLLDQERPNVFTQSVANILPGQSVKVRISYVETLRYEAGTYEWSFPMVVGKRYTPSGASAGAKPTVVHPDESGGGEPTPAAPDAPQQEDADAQRREERAAPTPEDGAARDGGAPAPDASRIDPPRVPKGMRAGHDISVEVSVDAGVPLEAVASATHEVEVERRGAAGALVRLKGGAAIPDRDFVLRYDVAGGRVEDALLAHASSRGRFFTLILQPPERVAASQVVPKELVFVLDTSGSMNGFPLEKAKETMRLALEGLHPQDTFNLITFAGDTHVLFDRPVAATRRNLSKARKFLDSRGGGGGTEMMQAIGAAFDGSGSSGRVRVVCFMTDGHVGNDFQILAEVQRHPHARVFSMGFGHSANRFLLDKMAEYGRGEVEYVAEKDPGSAAARRFYERVRDPLLTDLSVEWDGPSVSDVYPKVIPDLFGAKPVVIVGRYAGGAGGRVRLKGKSAGGDFVREIPVALPDAEERHDVLATLWARSRVDELMGRELNPAQSGDPAAAPQREEITRLGLDFRLMTQFTSFVAVEELSVTDGGEPRRVEVPVESPPAASSNATGTTVEYLMVTAARRVDSSSSSLGTTVTARSIHELPLNGRSTLALVTVAPGAAQASGARGGLSFNGQRPGSNSLVVDGVSADVGVAGGGPGAGAFASGVAPGLAAGGGANGVAPVAATQELTVLTEHVGAQYGRSTGAHVSVVTRSGTNAFHGSLFGHFGHEALGADDWFADRRGAASAPQRFGDFGGTLGGPVKKDRSFFFVSYEGQRQRRPAFAFTEVPTLAARLDAPALVRPFLEAFPVPNGAARGDGFAEFASAYSTPARLDAFVLRLEHNPGDRVTLDARYSAAGSSEEARGAGGSSLNTLDRVTTRAQTLTGWLVYMVTPSALAEVRANYSRVHARGSRLLDGFGGAVVPGPNTTDTQDTQAGSLLTAEGGSFVFDLGGRGAALARRDETFNLQRQLNLVGSLHLLSGAHSYKLGADYRRLSPSIGLPASERDLYFDGVAGALGATAARDARFGHAAAASRPVFDQFAAYAQDEWRGTARTTLTYGLRWELSPAPHAGGGAARPLAVTQAEDPSRLALAGPGAPPWRTTWLNFAPRLGLAHLLSDVTGRELVARAGFGLFYDAGGDESGHAFADSYPFKTGGAAFGVPFETAGAPAPNEPPAGAPLGAPLSAFDPRLKLPYTLRWHVSIERAFGGVHNLSAAYVGAAGRRLLLTRTLLDPSPDFSLVRLTTNGGASDYHSARFQFRRLRRGGLEALASYTLAKSLDDFSADWPSRALLRGGDAERGASDFDVRHAASGFVSYELPALSRGGALGALSRGWTLGALFNARSARPLNVVYGFPVSYGLAFLRPDLVGGVPLYVADPSAAGGRRLNPAAFVLPGTTRQGTLGRNALRGFPFYRLDLALGREFKFDEDSGLRLGAEVYNLLGRPNFDDPLGTLALGGSPGAPSSSRPDPYFGRSLSARGAGAWAGQSGGFGALYAPGGARTVQLSLRLTF